MKIYIENITPKTTNGKLDKLNKFLIKKEEYMEVYSEEGIYNISSNQMNKIKEYSEQKPIKIVSPFSAIIDYTKVESEIVYQLPIYHCSDHVIQFNYSIHKKSNLYLIVKGFNKKIKNQDVLSSMKTTIPDFVEEVFQISDVFFTIDSSIQPLDLSTYMEEFNEFFIALK